jgi:hypothetical protein
MHEIDSLKSISINQHDGLIPVTKRPTRTISHALAAAPNQSIVILVNPLYKDVAPPMKHSCQERRANAVIA